MNKCYRLILTVLNHGGVLTYRGQVSDPMDEKEHQDLLELVYDLPDFKYLRFKGEGGETVVIPEKVLNHSILTVEEVTQRIL